MEPMETTGDEGKTSEKDTPDEKKTTGDEGKTFEKDTLFECVQDCYQKGTRYRKGQQITGRKCLPYFVVKPEAKKEKEKK